MRTDDSTIAERDERNARARAYYRGKHEARHRARQNMHCTIDALFCLALAACGAALATVDIKTGAVALVASVVLLPILNRSSRASRLHW